jgi:hypothetical protein
MAITADTLDVISSISFMVHLDPMAVLCQAITVVIMLRCQALVLFEVPAVLSRLKRQKKAPNQCTPISVVMDVINSH